MCRPMCGCSAPGAVSVPTSSTSATASTTSPARCWRGCHGAPLYLEVNAPLAAERAAFGGLRLKRLAGAVERFTWRSARRVLAVTKALGQIVAELGVAAERIAVVPNGVVLARFPPRVPRPADGADDDGVTLGFVGFMRGWHGLDTVLRGMAGDPAGARLRLELIGTGPALAELERLAAELGLGDRVRFEGLVAHEQVPARLARFDIALQPRATAYASPLKLFDYMAAGCAIVAPDQPNIREVLEDGSTALLFLPDDAEAFWRAIRLLAEHRELRDRLGAAARARLEAADFTWSGNARRIACRVSADQHPGGR